jgi:hypothetical protein
MTMRAGFLAAEAASLLSKLVEAAGLRHDDRTRRQPEVTGQPTD